MRGGGCGREGRGLMMRIDWPQCMYMKKQVNRKQCSNRDGFLCIACFLHFGSSYLSLHTHCFSALSLRNPPTSCAFPDINRRHIQILPPPSDSQCHVQTSPPPTTHPLTHPSIPPPSPPPFSPLLLLLLVVAVGHLHRAVHPDALRHGLVAVPFVS